MHHGNIAPKHHFLQILLCNYYSYLHTYTSLPKIYIGMHFYFTEEENVESFVHLVKRAPPDDPPTPVRSTGNQICFINTVSTDSKESRRCIFPFRFVIVILP